MTSFEIYLFTRLDTFNSMSVTVMLVSLAISAIAGIGYVWTKAAKEGEYGTGTSDYKEWDDWYSTWAYAFKKSTPILAISALLVLLIPTQQEAAAIYLIPKITNSEAAKELSTVPVDAAKLLKLKMNQYMNELQPPQGRNNGQQK